MCPSKYRAAPPQSATAGTASSGSPRSPTVVLRPRAKRTTPIEASITSRTPPSSTSIALVNHAKTLHAHQSAARTHPAGDATPTSVVREQARDLGDREHEDKIEEEFEGGDQVLVAALLLALGHAPTPAQPGSGFVRHVCRLHRIERRRPAREEVQRLFGLRADLGGVDEHRQAVVG
jgi:hypothetical protein